MNTYCECRECSGNVEAEVDSPITDPCDSCGELECYCGENMDCYDDVEPPPEYDDSMDGDFDSGMASAGWGTDESYEDFGGSDDF